MGLLSNLFGKKAPHKAEPATTVGIGGHGFMLAPVCPCHVAHLENGSLVVQGVPGVEGVATIVLGSEPARAGAPSTEPSGDGAQVSRYGPDGPQIVLRGKNAALDRFFVRVDTGCGEASWMLLARSRWIDFPPGFALAARSPDDEQLHLFELFLLGREGQVETDAFISFQPHGEPVEETVINVPSGWEHRATGVLENEDGAVRWQEFAYPWQGRPFRKRYFVLPDKNGSVIMSASAPEHLADRLFAGADNVASSYALVGA
jgi:hypothetical protein